VGVGIHPHATALITAAQKECFESPWVPGSIILESNADGSCPGVEPATAFRVSTERFAQLQKTLITLGGVYEDLDILAHEFLCTSPNVRTPSLTDSIADWAWQVVEDRANGNSRITAAALLTAGSSVGTSILTESRRYSMKACRKTPSHGNRLFLFSWVPIG
jgi:hypothetical protein